MSNYPNNAVTQTLKLFYNLSKNDISDLYTAIENSPLQKSALFLTGMLFRASRLEKQFGFGIFIPSLVEVLIHSISEISINNEDIIFYLNKNKNDENLLDQLLYVDKYINALKNSSHLDEQIELLQKSTEKSIREKLLYDYKRQIHSLDDKLDEIEFAFIQKNENTKLKSELAEHKNKIESLESDIKTLSGDKKTISDELKSKSDKIRQLSAELNKTQETLSDKIDLISSQEATISDLKKSIATLKNEASSLKIDNGKLTDQINTYKNKYQNLYESHEKLIISSFSHEHFFLKRFSPNKFKRKLNELLNKSREEYSLK